MSMYEQPTNNETPNPTSVNEQVIPSFQPQMNQPSPVTAPKQNYFKKNLLPLIAIGLLVINIGITVVTRPGGIATGGSASVQQKLQEQKEWSEYTKKIGKENIEITNDKIVKQEYGSPKLIATITNTSSKKMDSITVNLVFEKKGKYVGYATMFLSDVPGNASVQESAYVPDEDFDTYSIDSIEAYTYE